MPPAPPNPLPEAVPLMERGLEHHRAGRIVEAAEAYAKALEIDPNYVQAHNNLAIALKSLDRIVEAIAHYEKAIAIQPDNASVHSNMGLALSDIGRFDEAVASQRRAISLIPDYADAHGNLGAALHSQGLLEDAANAYRKAIELNPDLVEAHTNLGNALMDQGRFDDAVPCHHKAIAINPDFAVAHDNLGRALNHLGRHDEAATCHLKALSLKPDDAGFFGNLGIAVGKLGRLDEAETCYRKAIALNPDFVEAHCNLGNVLSDQRILGESLECYKKAMAIRPNLIEPANNFLHTLLYVPDLTNEQLFDSYRQVIDGHFPAPPVIAAPVIATPPTPDLTGKLRIGYLSSDFYSHPLGDVILPLLSNHNHDQFEIFCYAGVARPDTITKRFQELADHWRPIRGLTDQDIAGLIRDDGIHIMVYLGGHFDDNHPGVATHRPAPAQVAMHGGATSALDEMDFWLTDDVLHPPPEKGGTTEQFTETLFRLPAFYIYPRTEGAPPVSTLPAEDNGFITFCSFNKPIKINDTVLDLWSQVLLAVPESRLMLKYQNYWGLPSIGEPMLERLDANGIPPERITLISTDDSFQDHLAHYAHADIALDPFPFNGATTTFQALWMGVPVISLLGDRFISRAGACILTHAGLGDLVADTPQAYIARAAALADDLPRLKNLRATLRRRAENSPLCDGPGHAANVEKAFRDIWASRKPGG